MQGQKERVFFFLLVVLCLHLEEVEAIVALKIEYKYYSDYNFRGRYLTVIPSPHNNDYLITWTVYPSIRLGNRERSGSVVECLTRDRRAVGSSLTGVTALWSLSKTHLSQLSTGSTQEDPSLCN